MDIDNLLRQMTLREKASLLSGSDMWHTRGIERLGIPEIMVCDGPHGLRKQESGQSVNVSVQAVCFPTAAATACSWDPELLRILGECLGEEAQAEKVSVVLGPGTNIKRSPLCGRNFEYFSEDPLLAGKLSAAFIEGVQSKGVGTSLKHYCVNNQEKYRMSINALVDERTLREIYLTAFEIAVKEAQPSTVMCSYNAVNDVHASDSKKLLTDILREEWGFRGLVVSDWGAVFNRVEGVKAGLDLEMPTTGKDSENRIVAAVESGALAEADVDACARRVLELVKKSLDSADENAAYDKRRHHEIAKDIAEKSAVLLKNENVLPFDKSKKLLVIGELAKKPRYQGAGSSYINGSRVMSLTDALDEAGCDYVYAPGYRLDDDAPRQKLIDEACALARDCTQVLLCAGLPESYEAEGFDRASIEMPAAHNALIEAVSAVCPNAAVALFTGASVSMPWIGKVGAVLNMYLGGEAGGEACRDLIYGIANPCGKLAETFALRLEDIPATRYFPGNRYEVEYREGIFVGYRYFATAGVPVLFPFGHGLSYTAFEYSDLQLSAEEIAADEPLNVRIRVKNIGARAGAEIVQVYVSQPDARVAMPALQLRAFAKVWLEAGEERAVEMTLDRRAFAYYDTQSVDWRVDEGTYLIRVGASSADLRAEAAVRILSDAAAAAQPPVPAAGWYARPDADPVGDEEFYALLGSGKRETRAVPVKGNFTAEESFEDMAQSSGLARFAMKAAKTFTRWTMHADKKDPNYLMIYEIFKTSPIRALSSASQGMFNSKMADGLVVMMNGKFFRGLGMILKGLKKDKEKK